MSEKPIVLAVPSGPGITRIEIRTPNNTINRELIRQLRLLLSQHRRDPEQRVLILRGAGNRLFSPGLDLRQVLSLDRSGMQDFMEDFSRLYLELFAHPKPTLALLAGHALAGGCILASSCDFRLAADSIRIGLTDLTRFFPIPAGCQQILAFRLGPAPLSRLVYEGKALTALDAERIGWLDRVSSPADLEEEGDRLASSLAAARSRAFEISKRNLLGDLPVRIEESDRLQMHEFLDGWFAPETRSHLESTLRNLSR